MEIWVTCLSQIKLVVGLIVGMHGRVTTRIPQLPHLIDESYKLPNIKIIHHAFG